MLSTSDLYKILLTNPLHWKETKLEIAGVEYTEANIVSAVIPPSALYEKFGIGNCVARRLDIEIFPIGTIPKQAIINVWVRLVLGDQFSEWLPQGEFFVSTRKENKITGTITIKAFDAMLKADDTWIKEDYEFDEWPKSQRDAVSDIAQRMGVEIDPRTTLSNTFSVDYPTDENGDLSMREVLSGIGVSNCANWVITAEGKLLQIISSKTLGEVFLGNGLADMDIGDPARPISKVILNLDGSTYFQAGDDTGNAVEASCPWASQDMAESVLSEVQGYVYQPFSGSNALLDPAAELGDEITVGGITATLAVLGRNLDRLCTATIGAPEDDETEDEYPYISKTERSLRRRVSLGTSYYGTKITRKNGLVIEKTDGEEVSAKAVFNAEELSFYDANGNRVLYFDPTTGTYKFVGYLSIQGLEDGESVLSGDWLQTGTILANLIKAGILQSKDGKTFVLDLDNGTFSMQGSGRFQSPNGRTYISVEGDEMVMYALDDKTGEYVDKIHFGFISGDNPADVSSTLDYPYMLLGKSGGAVGMIKEFYNGLWLGNSVPKNASGNFEGMDGAAGFFINTRTGVVYVVNGTDMKNVYAGTTNEVVMTSENVTHNGVRLSEVMPEYVTQEAYDAMEAAGTYNKNTPYFIQKEV